MKYIKTYKIFEDLNDFEIERGDGVPNDIEDVEFPSDIDEIEFDLDKYGVENYTVTNELVVIVNGGVYLDDYSMYDLPFSFDTIKGDFTATRCKLCSFGGLPRLTYGHLDVSQNNLMDYDIGYFPVAKSYNFEYNEISDELLSKIESEIRVISEYGIWKSDGSLNEKRLEMYQKEFKGI